MRWWYYSCRANFSTAQNGLFKLSTPDTTDEEKGWALDAALTNAFLCDSNDKNGAETRKSINGFRAKEPRTKGECREEEISLLLECAMMLKGGRRVVRQRSGGELCDRPKCES